MIELPILNFENVDKENFLEFWKSLYKNENEYLYKQNIGRDLSNPQVVMALYKWKNGGNISAKKEASIQKNYIDDHVVYPKHPDKMFLKAQLQKSGGAIWRIFWMHCHYPEIFPIYDQHVHRAMAFIRGQKKVEIPSSDAQKIEIYIDQFIPFHQSFLGPSIKGKDVDEALFSFGKFLKSPYKPLCDMGLRH